MLQGKTIVVTGAANGIGAETAIARWRGEPFDYDHALLVLMAKWDAGRSPPRPDSSIVRDMMIRADRRKGECYR